MHWPDLWFPPINLWTLPMWNDNLKNETPCTRECCYDTDKGHCISCGRTLEDLKEWKEMSTLERRARTASAKWRMEVYNASRS